MFEVKRRQLHVPGPGGSDRVGYEYLPVAGRGTEEPRPRVQVANPVHTQVYSRVEFSPCANSQISRIRNIIMYSTAKIIHIGPDLVMLGARWCLQVHYNHSEPTNLNTLAELEFQHLRH